MFVTFTLVVCVHVLFIGLLICDLCDFNFVLFGWFWYCKWDWDRDGNERWGQMAKNMDEMKQIVSKLALKKWIAKENKRIKQNVNGEKMKTKPFYV